MSELKLDIKATIKIPWVFAINFTLAQKKKPLQLKDFRHYIQQAYLITYWTKKHSRCLSVVLNRLKDEKRIAYVKYPDFCGFYGEYGWTVREDWADSEIIVGFKNFDPYTGDFKN